MSGILGTGGVSSVMAGRVGDVFVETDLSGTMEFLFWRVRGVVEGGGREGAAMDVLRLGVLRVEEEEGGVGILDNFVGVRRPLRGMREGVTMTVGSFGGVEPMTDAIGEEFHLGRAANGISPPVPVFTPCKPRSTEGAFDRGVKIGILRREDREEGGACETERVRGVAIALSLRWEGRELILAPDLIDEESLDDVLPVGDTAPCVRVVLLDVLPDDCGLVSAANERFFTS